MTSTARARKKCTCVREPITINGEEYTLLAACEIAHGEAGSSCFEGPHPQLLGHFDAQSHIITVARRSTVTIEIDTLLHELGHYLAWSIAPGGLSEASANLAAGWFRDVTKIVVTYGRIARRIPRRRRVP
jgi:hypothetical protein